jgi:hypothetical protein
MYALLLWASLMSQATLAPASDLELPAYQKLRYDEDYSYLRDPTKRTDWFDRIKYIPLSEDGENYLSIGDLVRERYEYTHNPLWGEDPQDKRRVFLQRYMLHADFHLGKLARAFSQLQSAIESGRRGGPSPVDEDKLDFHQAFVDFSLEFGEGRRLTLQGGRQEMFYGSSRLIDVRQGPNVRRSFDSVRALLKWGDWRIDGIAARPVRNKDGVADNATDHTQALWGIYGASKQNIIPGASL